MWKIEETSKELVIFAMEISRQKVESASGLILAPFDGVWEAWDELKNSICKQNLEECNEIKAC